MAEAPSCVAVTGASGYIGTRLIARLEQDEAIERIVALDVRPLAPSPKVTFYHHDVNDPLDHILAQNGVQSVVHLAFILRPSHNQEEARRVNVEGMASVLKACASARIGHIIYLSSTTVYGAHPDNPALLDEDSPVRPSQGFQYARDKAQAEKLLAEFKESYPHIAVTVLRGSPVLGAYADNFITRALTKPVLVGIRGYDPPMQFLHEDDLMTAMAKCLLTQVPGVYNVAGKDALLWSEMARLSGRRLIFLPPPLLYGLTELTWRLRLQHDSPASGLDFIRYPWVASTSKIQRELGIDFRYSSREAVASFLRGCEADSGRAK